MITENQVTEISGSEAADTWWLWLISLSCWIGAAGFILYQILIPSDGARVSKMQDAWTSQGIRLHVYSSQSGLRDGDLLLGINHIALETWLEALLNPGRKVGDIDPRWPVTYEILRDGNRLQVNIQPTHQPLQEIIIEHWGVLLYTGVSQVLILLVFLLRPGNPGARTLLIFGMTSSHFYVWSFYLQLPDLTNKYGFWFYSFVSSFLWLANWASALHFSLVFPHPLPILRRKPYLAALPYLASFLSYVLLLYFSWFRSPDIIIWIGSWGQWQALIPILLFIPTFWMIVRQYRWLRDEPSRKKIRLLAFSSLAVGSLTILFYLLPPFLGLPELDPNFMGVLLILLPVSISLAILRYQLFDIDVIIRRTLVYGALTAILALVYFGIVVVFQELVSRLTGENRNEIVTVMSTMAIAALFTPLRRRVQSFIDRRFYRQKYDAERVLAAFSKTLREEVDLDRLTNSILEVVEESLQPAYIFLWLREVDLQSKERQFEENSYK